jgi:hypothetical protein
LDWLKQNTRLKLRAAMDEEYIEDLPSDPEDVGATTRKIS